MVTPRQGSTFDGGGGDGAEAESACVRSVAASGSPATTSSSTGGGGIVETNRRSGALTKQSHHWRLRTKYTAHALTASPKRVEASPPPISIAPHTTGQLDDHERMG